MKGIKKVMFLLLAGAMLAAFGAVTCGPGLLACYQSYPFLLGGEIAGPAMLDWNMPSWGSGSSCGPGLPLFFNAHGFGFPMSLGNFRIGFIPFQC